MFTKIQFGSTARLIGALLVGWFLFSACSLFNLITEQSNPTQTPTPSATATPTELPVENAPPAITLEIGSMATGLQTITVPAVQVGDRPYWEVLPEYTQVTLLGYPISNSLKQPQIFIFPLGDLEEVSVETRGIIADLQELLDSPREIQIMPFLPLQNGMQSLHFHVQYLDFADGQGMRYLTEFDQGVVPVNNDGLIYTYQGLTNDGKYYVSAILPVNHPSLPENGRITGNEPPEFTNNYHAYLADVVASLNPQAANTFTPDLTQLDAMLGSLEVK